MICLLKVLQENGPDAASVKNWPVIGQFSSIGSLGPTKDNWLCKEWLQSLSATRGLSGPTAESNLFLVIFMSFLSCLWLQFVNYKVIVGMHLMVICFQWKSVYKFD